MRTPDQVLWDFVQQWLDKAHKDLRAAEVLLGGDFDDYENVGFHAQQAAEKFIKAFLVRHTKSSFRRRTTLAPCASSSLSLIPRLRSRCREQTL